MSDAPKLTSPWTGDRSRGLRISGGILIALGVACLGFTALMLLGNALNPKQRWEPALLYGLLAATFFALGFGSYWGRRWARDLILVGSAYSLAISLLGTPLILWMVWRVLYASDARLSGEAVGCVVTTVLAFMMAIFIALPAAFLLFYARRDVRLTVERLDPVPRWTQAQPLPVLGAALVYASAAPGLLVSLVQPALPVPGRILTGAAARAVLVAIILVAAGVAWGLYRGRRSAWVAAIVLVVVGLAFALLTFRDLDIRDLQSAMGASEEEMALMSKIDIMPGLVAIWAITGLLWLGYLWWIRKYFRAPGATA